MNDINKIQKEIIEEFKNFSNQLDKYDYLIKLGKKANSINPKYKKEENTIKDCQVETWFYADLKNGKIFYYIDSKSLLTKGIISLLLRVLSGQKPEDIQNSNLYFIEKIGLKNNFSFLRANSLGKLVDRMKLETKKHGK